MVQIFGMIERRGSFGLALETGESAGISRDVIGQKLEGDKSTELYILGLIDDAHPSAAQFLDNVVMRYGLANHWRESYVGETRKSM